MKKTKNWKITNYLGKEVLVHSDNPRCIIGKTQNPTRPCHKTISHDGEHYYMIHWLEKTKLTEKHSQQIIHEAIAHWTHINHEEVKKAA